MSSADDLQLKHRVPQALALRLRTILDGNANAHEWHQAGVLLTKMADATWRVRYPEWWKDMNELFRLADVFYLQAICMSRDDLPTQDAVVCDRALAFALALRPGPRAETLYSIAEMLNGVISRLMPQLPDPQSAHQVAIAESFLMRAYWWEWFATGRHHDPHAVDANTHMVLAGAAFGANSSKSPDKNAAFASHLLALALTYSECGAFQMRWQRSLEAFRYAGQSKDRAQQLRALAIACLGNTGERWLLWFSQPRRGIEAAITVAQEATKKITYF